MDKLGAFSGAPGILGAWQAMVRGAPCLRPCFPYSSSMCPRVVWGTWRFRLKLGLLHKNKFGQHWAFSALPVLTFMQGGGPPLEQDMAENQGLSTPTPRPVPEAP